MNTGALVPAPPNPNRPMCPICLSRYGNLKNKIIYSNLPVFISIRYVCVNGDDIFPVVIDP